MSGMRILVALLFLGAVATMEAAAADISGNADSKDQAAAIRRLIDQLGDPDFDAREEATRKLLGIGKEALPALEEARKSDRFEVAKRADMLAEKITARLKEESVQEAFATVNREGIDRFIDRLALGKEAPKEKDWDAVVQLAEALAFQASKIGGRNWSSPKLGYRGFKTIRDCADQIEFTRTRMAVDGVKSDLLTTKDSILVSSGSIGDAASFENSIVFVNGDIDGADSFHNCIVFCHGKMTSMHAIDNSVIIATGEIEHSATATNTFFQVRSVGTHCTANQNVYVNCIARVIVSAKDNSLIDSDKGPLAKLKFFDLAEAGIELTQDDDKIQVKRIAKGKLFARAGLREADEIVAVADTAVTSMEDCRRALRRKIAVGGDAHLKIQRGEETLEVKVRWKE
jgi:hypothetical protein